MTEGFISRRGRLLVATPGLTEATFFRTVILMVEHTPDGAAGVVLNRPTDTELAGPLAGWRLLAADPQLIFIGGPVQPDAAVCLARAAPGAQPSRFEPILDGLGVLDLSADTSDVRDDVDQLRVFAGYAGWGPGQLEDELDQGAWYVFDADPNDALTPMPGALWRFVLKRQGGQHSLIANFPADPSMN